MTPGARCASRDGAGAGVRVPVLVLVLALLAPAIASAPARVCPRALAVWRVELGAKVLAAAVSCAFAVGARLCPRSGRSSAAQCSPCGSSFCCVHYLEIGLPAHGVDKLNCQCTHVPVRDGLSTPCSTEPSAEKRAHASVAAAAPPSQFPDRHFTGSPGYALYPSARVA